MMNKQLNKLSLRLFVALLLTMVAKFSCAKKERAQSGTDINRITVAGSGVLTGNDAAATIEIKSLAPAYKGGTVLNLVWTATATPSTNASFQTAMTLDGGETWALSGGLPIPVDPLDRVEHSIEINLPAGDFQSTIIRIGLFDDAGLRAIATSDSFIVDSTAPKLTSLTLNEGDSLTLTNYVRVSLAATDVAESASAGSKISDFCLQQNSADQPEEDSTCWRSVDGPETDVEKEDELEINGYYYTLGFTSGTYAVRAWVRDQAGNISSLVGTSGEVGVDQAQILFTPAVPPLVNNVFASSSDAPSNPMSEVNLTAVQGSTIYIKWRATDASGFPSGSIRLEYSTDSVNYSTIASGLVNGANSGCTVNHGGTSLDDSATGCYTWSNGSPTSTYLAIRVVATNIQGFIGTGQSVPLNTPGFKYLAGNIELGVGGSARGGVLVNQANARQNIAVQPNGRIFFLDQKGLLSIKPEDGVIQLLIPTTGTAVDGAVSIARLKSPLKLAMDYSGNILIADSNLIRRLNTNSNPWVLETISGNGTLTADGVQADKLKILSGLSTNSPFFVAPNGDIYFQSEQYASKPSTGAKIRFIRAVDDTVQSIPIAGVTEFMGIPDQDISECIVHRFAATTNLASKEVSKVLLTLGPSATSGGCSYFSAAGPFQEYSEYIGLSPQDLSITQAPLPFNYPEGAKYGYREHREAHILTGMDGKIYGLDFGLGGRIFRYNESTNQWDKIAGTDQFGECVDGTVATSCAMKPESLFVTAQGVIFLMDGPVLRVIHEGKIYSVAGQSLSYGNGGRALEARFGEITSIQLWGSKVSVADKREARIREFDINGNIAATAGNGVYQYAVNGSAAATSQMRWSFDVFNSRISVNTNGDIYSFRSRPAPLSYVKRSNNTWNQIGNTISGYGTYVMGQNATNILLGYFTYCAAIPSSCNAALIEVNKTTGARVTVLETPSNTAIGGGTAFCANGSALSSCLIPPPTMVNLTAAHWDAPTSTWLVAKRNDDRVVKLAASGTMSTLITLPRKVFTLAAERSGDLSTNNLYYCGVNGASRSLYKMNLNTTTETVLTMPVSKMICADTGDIIVSDSRDSILFNFVQNGLHGVGEIINP